MAKIISNFEEIIAGLLLFLVFIIVLTEIMIRSLGGFSLVWPDEVSRILFVWSVFFGASAGFKRGTMITVDILYRILPAKIQKVMISMCHILITALLMLIISQGFILANKFAQDQLPLSGLPQGYLYYSLPIGCTFILTRVIQSFIVNVLRD